MTRVGSQRHSKQKKINYSVFDVSNIQVFNLRNTCTRSFMAFLSCIRIKQSGGCQDVPEYQARPVIQERNTIKLYVQVFLRMNTWMFETCRRHYNDIKILM
jgi:hypothetical protein